MNVLDPSVIKLKDSLEPVYAAIEWLTVLEATIKNSLDESCPSSFEEKFCDSNELLSVFFNTTNLKVLYLTSHGHQVTYDWPMSEFIAWLEESN